MNKSVIQSMTSKWALVVGHYEKIKQKRDPNFKTVSELCDAFQVSRKDIRKYYERWAKAGKDPNALIPKKRGPSGQAVTIDHSPPISIDHFNLLTINKVRLLESSGEYWSK